MQGTWTSFGNRLNNSLVMIIAVQLVVLPVMIFAYICPNYRKLKRSRMMDKFGAIYDMIDLKHKEVTALLWSVFFLLRRILFSIGVLFMVDYPVFQILLFILPTLAVIVMIGLARPLATPFENKQEMYNNFSILLISYCLLCFTLFVPEPETRYNIAYVLILLTIQNIVVSLIIIGSDPVR